MKKVVGQSGKGKKEPINVENTTFFLPDLYSGTFGQVGQI